MPHLIEIDEAESMMAELADTVQALDDRQFAFGFTRHDATHIRRLINELQSLGREIDTDLLEDE